MGQDKNKNSANGLARFYDYFFAFFWGLAVLVDHEKSFKS